MTWEEQLVKAYTDSRERLIKTIERRLRWGQSAAQERALLDLVDKELARLNAVTHAWTQAAVQQSFLAGAADAYKIIAPNTAMPSYSAFMGTHQRAIEMLVHNTQEFLTITNNLIARQAADVIRDMGVLTTTHKFAENLTWKQMRAELQKTLEADGFYRVPYRFSRGSMRVDSYADLVARTTTAEATNTGTINQMTEMGEYLVKMTAHNTTCKVCAARQGRVYKLQDFPSGDERNQFPHISMGMPRWPTYKTIHVNCRHRCLPFVWSQKDQKDKDAALGRSGKPFDTDPRSEAEVKRYNAAQQKLAERLADRKQWEKYKAVLPEQAPSFSGFRAMKAAGSERYVELRADYSKVLRDLRKEGL